MSTCVTVESSRDIHQRSLWTTFLFDGLFIQWWWTWTAAASPRRTNEGDWQSLSTNPRRCSADAWNFRWSPMVTLERRRRSISSGSLQVCCRPEGRSADINEQSRGESLAISSITSELPNHSWWTESKIPTSFSFFFLIGTFLVALFLGTSPNVKFEFFSLSDLDVLNLIQMSNYNKEWTSLSSLFLDVNWTKWMRNEFKVTDFS